MALHYSRLSVLLHTLLLYTSKNYISAAHGTDNFCPLRRNRRCSLRCHAIVGEVASRPACSATAVKQIRTDIVHRLGGVSMTPPPTHTHTHSRLSPFFFQMCTHIFHLISDVTRKNPIDFVKY